MVIGWIIVIIMAFLAIFSAFGGGVHLSTAYNTLTNEKKEDYSTRKICLFMGLYLAVLAISLALFLLFLSAGFSDTVQITVSIIYFLLVVLGVVFVHKYGFNCCKK